MLIMVMLVWLGLVAGCSSSTATIDWSCLPNDFPQVRQDGLLQEIEQHSKRQDQAFQQKKLEPLVLEWQGKLREDSASPKNLFLYGRLLGLLGNPKDSLLFFYRALELDPEFVYAYYGLGVHFFRQKALREAKSFFEKCLQLQQSFVPALLGMANLEVVNDRASAIARMKLAITFQPEDAEIQHSLGELLLAEQKLAESLVYLEKAVQLAPTNIQMLRSLAQAYIESKNYPQAITMLRKITGLLPTGNNFRRQITKEIIILEQLMDSSH